MGRINFICHPRSPITNVEDRLDRGSSVFAFFSEEKTLDPRVRKDDIPIFLAMLLALVLPGLSGAQPTLPVEPDEETRLEEIYDHEASMVMFLYSLKGTEEVDYVVGRKVWEHQRSVYGNPVYYLEPYPLFYWWNHTMWNDPEQDGVNGNELVYQEDVDFDATRYKPCLFNGQRC